MSMIQNVLKENNSQKKYSQAIGSNKFQAHKLQKNMMAILAQNDDDNHDDWYTTKAKMNNFQPGLNKKGFQQGKFVKLQSSKNQNKQNSSQDIAKQICNEQRAKQQSQQQVQNWQDIWNMLDNNIKNEQKQKLPQKKEEAEVKEEENCQLTQQELQEIFGSNKNNEINKNKEQFQVQVQVQQKNEIIVKKDNIKIIESEQLDNELLEIWNQLEEQSENQKKQKQKKIQEKFQQQQNKLPQTSTLNNATQHHSPQNLKHHNNLSIQQSNKKNSKQEQQQVQIFTFSPVLKNHKASQSQSQLSQSIINTQKKQIGQQQILDQIRKECYNNQMTKLIFSEDFVVHNYKLYSLTPYRQKTYTYLGFKEAVNQKNQILSNHYLLYSFQTKENILKIEPEAFHQSYAKDLVGLRKITLATGHEVYKKVIQYDTKVCYKVSICSTGQRVATLFWKKIKDGLVFELKLFDEYEKKHTTSIVIIEVRDGYVAQSCYCDTNVFIANQKTKKSNSQEQNPNKPSIQKLKMILNIRNQKLTANMGINGIQSSPYNCCLQNKQKKFVYLMGMFKQQNFNKFIVKIGQGLSPLIGMVIAAGRKIYIDSFNE